MFAFRALAPLALIPLLGAPAQSQPAPDCTGTPSATRLYVNVSNVKFARGLIAVTLYADDSKKFLAKRGALYVGRVPAQMPTTRVCIFVPRPAIYGLAVYHDADANRSFKRNSIGLPAEGYGFSNNASTFLGLPAFRSVRIAVPRNGHETGVRLRYP